MILSSAWLFRFLSVCAFCLCGQCIACASSPIIPAIIAVATVGLFVYCRGNAVVVWAAIGIGPIVNCTALYCDPYVYTIEIVILTYLGCFLGRNARTVSLKKPDGVLLSYILLLIVLFCSTVVHIFLLGGNIPLEIRLVRVFIIGLFLLMFLKSTQKPGLIIYAKTVVLTTLLISTIGLMEFCVRGIFFHNWGREPQSVFNGSEILAMYLCSTIPFIIMARPMVAKGVWTYISSFAAPLALLLLITTRSRAGLLSLLVFLIFYGFHALRTKSRKSRTILVVVLISCLSVFAITGLKTFHSGFHFSSDVARLLFLSRLGDWHNGIMVFKATPLWGAGSGNNFYNTYIQMLGNYGIFGLGAFLIFLVSIFVKYFRNAHSSFHAPFHQGLLWSAIVLLIAGIGESLLGNQLGYYILFLFFMVGRTPQNKII